MSPLELSNPNTKRVPPLIAAIDMGYGHLRPAQALSDYLGAIITLALVVVGFLFPLLLLRNTVKWVLRDEQPITIQGLGLIEAFAYETDPGFAVHLLNYTNPNTHRGWYREFYPVGAQVVRFEVPKGKKVSRVQLLKAEMDIPFKRVKDSIEFTVPSVTDYEVAAIYS